MQSLLSGDAKLLRKDKVCGLDGLPTSGVIGLYFSAKWCMPCRQFTPKLAEAYKSIRAAGKELEIIYFSADKDEVQFGEYYEEHPWLALPFAEREKKTEIQRKFEVRGIPALVLLDAATGKLITADGRQALQSDWEGNNYPWIPPTPVQAIGGVVVTSDRRELSAAKHLDGKYIGFYFCDESEGCTTFTQGLRTTYTSLLNRGEPFSIVHVAQEDSRPSFIAESLPWVSLPSEAEEAKQLLRDMFRVTSYPSLIVVCPDGKTVSEDGVTIIKADTHGKEFPWLDFTPSLPRQSRLMLVKQKLKAKTSKSCCIQ